MGGRRSLRIATVIFISALLLFTTKGIRWVRLLPHRKGDAFPRLEEGNVPINTSWFGMFWGISRVWGKSLTARRYPPLTPDQSEKLIEFRERSRSRIHKKTTAKYKRMHDELRHSLTQFFITDFVLT
ncbi:hypothetical protein TNCV_3087571 [Trichonephila clavipes]|uniref:Uncharacterized protein n=1 Tax=Trichonephila clavipes TaxID=2585209 RepID=A0A8X6V0D5_TRICX|nr:hypothetical protein TNCV_3087571 [Trichonephila clavipes]